MKFKGVTLAELVNVKPPYLVKEVRRGRLIKGDDRKYDSNNPVNRNWLISKNINPDKLDHVATQVQKKQLDKLKKPRPPVVKTKQIEKVLEKHAPSDPGDFGIICGLPDEMLDMTIRQLVLRHTSIEGVKLYVDTLDKLMSARKKDIDAQEKTKDLVSKDFIEHLKSFVDTLMNQLFDYCESAPMEIIPFVKADPDAAKIKLPEMMKKTFTKLAQETQRQIKREINKYSKDRRTNADTTD